MKDKDSIFLLNKNGGLKRVPYQQYQSEGILHSLIDKHPELIVGDQINPADVPRWIVVKREAGIPGSEEESNRWSVDHLFLDQYGRPTFVEVKRSTDTRIRREVVGQMLDYAANALKYWPVDQIKTLASENYGGLDKLEDKLIEFLELDDEAEETEQALGQFWNTVENNLRNGQVRLLFVADEIPSELRRIIEFLNEHMPIVEVLGVEIRQYKHDNIQALVPRVVGQTESARQRKNPSGQTVKKTTKEDFLNQCPEEGMKNFFNKVFTEANERGFKILWGTKGFSVRATLPDGREVSFLYGYPPGVSSSLVPYFQAYLGYINDPRLYKSLKEAYMKHIHFEAKGQHTLEIRLDKQGLRKAEAGLTNVMDIVKNIVAGNEPD